MTRSWTIHSYGQVGSTQDTAKELIAHNVVVPFVVSAECQTNGRGRSGRSWHSLGGNIQATLVLPMNFDLAQAANYSFVTSLAVSSAIGEYARAGTKIEHKWPNDVWVNDAKIAGILIEVYQQHLLIGTGVNIAHAPDGAIALNDVSDDTPSTESFMKALLNTFDTVREALERGGFGVILDQWLEKARGLHEDIRVRTLIEEFHGVFDGLEPDGALRVLVNGESAPRIVRSADVFFGKE